MAPRKPMTAREALLDVLKRSKREMTVKEIVEKSIPKAPGLKSMKTAYNTVSGTLREEAVKGTVVKVKTGVYRIASAEEKPEPVVESVAPEPETAPEPQATPHPKPGGARKRRTRSTARKSQAAAAA